MQYQFIRVPVMDAVRTNVTPLERRYNRCAASKYETKSYTYNHVEYLTNQRHVLMLCN